VNVVYIQYMNNIRRFLLAFLAVVGSMLLLSAVAQARPLLKQGDIGTDVKNLNKQLAKLTYLTSAQSKSSTYSSATFHAVMAYQKVRGLTRDGVAGPSTRKRLAESAKVTSRPRPRTGGASKRLEVDIQRQVLFLISSGKVRRTIAISSGSPGHDTPRGSYTIFRKEQMSYSVPFKTWLPWASYFTSSGIAFHQYASVPPYPASHGCVRIPESFAREVYQFAGFGVPVKVV
jgi:L,D-transpeptidase catalytic domain/Putative peptidoglycan binding domain